MDDGDSDLVSGYRWVAMRAKRGNLYAQTGYYLDDGTKRFHLMHRLIMGLGRQL